MAMRDTYRPVALRGSIIYFVTADLARIDPMYQYSLEYFTQLFEICIDKSDKATQLQTRLNNILEFQTNFIFRNVCRGLFERHKLIFAFLICSKIMRNVGGFTENEWGIFIRGAGVIDRAGQPSNPSPKTMSELQWDTVNAL